MATKNSLAALTDDKINRDKPGAVKTRDSIPGKVSTAKPAAVTASGGSSSIASPLTETARTTVPFEQFDDFNVWSVLIDVATQITMTDANGSEVIFNYTDPNTP